MILVYGYFDLAYRPTVNATVVVSFPHDSCTTLTARAKTLFWEQVSIFDWDSQQCREHGRAASRDARARLDL